METDISSGESIVNLIGEAQKHGDISMPVNAAGASPGQAPVEAILKVGLHGTAVPPGEVGKVIREGGVGVTISSHSGHRMPAPCVEADGQPATPPTEELLSPEVPQPRSIRDTLHACQTAKRRNVKRVMAEAVKWGAEAQG